MPTEQSSNTQNSNRLKEHIKAEYLKCKNDVVYFLRNYCYVQHPTRGRVKFNLYPFQEELAREIVNPSDPKRINTIINKSRQLGISTLMAGISCWMIVFKPDVNILIIATKQLVAGNLITKIKYMYESLPGWVVNDPKKQTGKKGTNIIDYNKQSIKLKNNSVVKAVAASKDAGRSEAVTLLIIDEAAHIEDIDEIYTAIKPTLAAGGRCVALSSPKGMGNFFHRTYSDAVLGKNTYKHFELKWDVHPERDQAWFDRECADMDEQEIAQEYNCDFIASGHTVIPPAYTQRTGKRDVREPIEKRGGNKELWIWDYSRPGHKYILGIDSGRGDGGDYSTIQVIDTTTCEQVAEYQGHLSPTDFARVIVSIGFEYNMALAVAENNTVGYATVEQLVNSGYPNLYYTIKGGVDVSYNEFTRKYMNSDTVPGFTNNQRTRPLIIEKIKEYFKTDSIIIHSARTHQEMSVFIWYNGKAQATNGMNDDLMLALGLALFVRDTHAEFMQTYDEATRIMLSNMQNNPFNTQHNSVYRFGKTGQNPYLMNVGHNVMEDFRWVLGGNY